MEGNVKEKKREKGGKVTEKQFKEKEKEKLDFINFL
jgi:hypothetical protein